MQPVRVALLTSKAAPGLERLLEDPNRGATWELVLTIGSERAHASLPLLESAGVPVELRPIRGVNGFRNLRFREDYDDELAQMLAGVRADWVILSGYDYILTEPLLERFPRRVLSLHDADLSLRSQNRLYAGTNPVYDALLSGERETRQSVYMVTRSVATGPLFLLGGAFPVAAMALDARERGDAAFLKHYAQLHRAWMHSAGSGAMLQRTVELLAGGHPDVIGDVVWVDGAPAPCRMGEAPGVCHEPETMVVRGIPRSCPFIE